MTRRAIEFYLVRHGETEWNRQSRLQGQTDIALNEKGISQSILLGEELRQVPFGRAYSSDLSRAFQTAQLVLQAHQIPIITSPQLRERNAGQLEGQPLDQVNAMMRPFFLSTEGMEKESYMNSSWHPEMETAQSVLDRVSQFLLNYVKASECVGHPVLVVTHGFVLRSFLDHFSFMPRRRWVIKNCGFIRLRMEEGTFQLLECNGVTEQLIV